MRNYNILESNWSLAVKFFGKCLYEMYGETQCLCPFPVQPVIEILSIYPYEHPCKYRLKRPLICAACGFEIHAREVKG